MPFVSPAISTFLAGTCLLAVAGCSTGDPSSAGGVASFAPAARKAAPDLSGTTLGQPSQFSLASQRGRVVVVNYWASWCDPCRDEVPQLDAAFQEFHPKGVTFIGVDFHGDTDAEARSFLTGHSVPYDSLSDPDSSSVLAFKGKVTISAPPLTMVIDKQGKIAAVVNGIVSLTQLRDLLTATMAEPA